MSVNILEVEEGKKRKGTNLRPVVRSLLRKRKDRQADEKSFKDMGLKPNRLTKKMARELWDKVLEDPEALAKQDLSGRVDEVFAYGNLEWVRNIEGVNEMYIKIRTSGHPIWKWAERVRGLGDLTVMVFLGEIDPYICTSSGKAWAYFGLIPEGKLKAGRPAKGRRMLKSIAWVTAGNILHHEDIYYTRLYEAKRLYYESIGKNAPEGKAKYWLAKLIVSHGWEIIRRAEGLEIFKPIHRTYIPPKMEDDELNNLVLSKVTPLISRGKLVDAEKLYGKKWREIIEAVRR